MGAPFVAGLAVAALVVVGGVAAGAGWSSRSGAGPPNASQSSAPGDSPSAGYSCSFRSGAVGSGTNHAPAPPGSSCQPSAGAAYRTTVDILQLSRDGIALAAFRADANLTYSLVEDMDMTVRHAGALCTFSVALANAPVGAILAVLAGASPSAPQWEGGGGGSQGGSSGAPRVQVLGQPVPVDTGLQGSGAVLAAAGQVTGSLHAGHYLLVQAGAHGIDPASVSADDHWTFALSATANLTPVALPNAPLACGFMQNLDGATLSAAGLLVGGQAAIDYPFAGFGEVRAHPARGAVGQATLTVGDKAFAVTPGTCPAASGWGAGRASLAVDHWASTEGGFLWTLAGAYAPDSWVASPC